VRSIGDPLALLPAFALRMLIWQDAISFQNTIAEVSAEGSRSGSSSRRLN
jgi:hypothetical protein